LRAGNVARGSGRRPRALCVAFCGTGMALFCADGSACRTGATTPAPKREILSSRRSRPAPRGAYGGSGKPLTRLPATLTFISVLKLTWIFLAKQWERTARSGSGIGENPLMSSQPRRRRLEAEEIGDVTVVSFMDRKILDEQNIQVIGEQLFSLVDESGRKKLLLNFSNVEYMSSAALGKLITLNKKVQAAGGQLVL